MGAGTIGLLATLILRLRGLDVTTFALNRKPNLNAELIEAIGARYESTKDTPLQEGANFDFSFITKPLDPFRNRVTLITGLDMPEAMANEEEPGGDHARGAVLLSGSRPRRNAVSPYLNVTVDQLIAQKHGQDTLLPSLQLGVEDTGNFGNCNWGYHRKRRLARFDFAGEHHHRWFQRGSRRPRPGLSGRERRADSALRHYL